MYVMTSSISNPFVSFIYAATKQLYSLKWNAAFNITCLSRIIRSIYIYKYKKTFKNEQRNRDDTAKKRVNTSGVGESNNYYEDIYNIYTSLQQHSLTIPIDSSH